MSVLPFYFISAQESDFGNWLIYIGNKKINSKLNFHQELRLNLKERIRSGEKVFQGIIGYDDTVLPDLERAILAGHSINFLGLRGQAKTKMARLIVQLFDDYVPKVKGSPLNEDPLMPLTTTTKNMIRELGDDTPISWIHKSERYSEKLATPDVNIADLIGDIDPITTRRY